MNLDKITRANVKAMKAYSSARDEYISDGSQMVFLDANENPFDASSKGLNRYPDPLQRELKTHIASLKKITTQQILLGNGSDEVLDLIFRAFCEPSIDHIMTFPPTYGMYKVLANLNAVGNKEILLKKDFELDVEKILSEISSTTKLIFVCSPNNPSGNDINTNSIKKILDNFNGIVIIDEAYIDFSEQKSWISELDNYPNLIVSQTLSKAYGLAGIRLGMCFASKEIITILNKIKPPYNINVISQKKALEKLQSPKLIQKEIDTILTERKKLVSALQKVSYVEKIYPSSTNFVLIKVDNALKKYEELLSKGFVVRNRSTQALCENTLRISVGTPQENQKLIDILKNLEN